MKFKIVKGSSLYDKMIEFQKECNAAMDAARKILVEVKGKEYCMSNHPHVLSGGISAIVFADGKAPAGWVKANVGHANAFRPHPKHKACKEIRDKIEALPLVRTSALNKLLNYKEQSYPNPHGHGSVMIFCPSVQFLKDVIVYQLNDRVKYTPPEGAQEILVSEYNRLIDPPKQKKERLV